MDDSIAEALRNGTLCDVASIELLVTRRGNLARQTALPADVRDRGLTIFDAAINTEVALASSAGEPIVQVVRRAFLEFGRIVTEHNRSLAQGDANKNAETVNSTEAQVRQPTNHMEDRQDEDTELPDEDSTDDVDEEQDEDSDEYKVRKGKSKGESKGKGKGKRKPDRPKAIDKKQRIKDALLARQLRKFLTHSSPHSDTSKDPRRRLYGPFAQPPKASKEASGSPDTKEDSNEAGEPESSSTKRFTRQLATKSHPAENMSNIQQATASRAKARDEDDKPSLIVKLKVSQPRAQEDSPSPDQRPSHRYRTRKGKGKEPLNLGSVRSTTKRAVKTKDREQDESDTEMQDADPAEDTNKKNKKTTQTRQPSATAVPQPILVPDIRVPTHNHRTRLSTKGQPPNIQSTQFIYVRPQPPTPRPQPYVFPPGTTFVFEPIQYRPQPDPPVRDPSPAVPDSQATITTASSPSLSSPPSYLPSSPPVPLPSTPTPSQPPSSTSTTTTSHTFPPFPPLSPRTLPNFHNGALIALENILSDHEENSELSLLGIIQELDDTRPIVTDWEHLGVMRGGKWVYQALRELVAEMSDENENKNDDGDGDGDEEMNEDRDESADVEMCVTYLGSWIQEEMRRRGVVA
ncbi:SOBP multi-domain protein [Pyrenophora teres f. teres]|uniref:SOBP multi-domain protein n=1 Tax=Pyrenophora teres f. teres TaxID=97479 RepID=A0A6S6W8C0_9PLEO|nr:hypothetical protein PTNB29_02932 [Pyrenophora teres f. teres]CAE7175679.1 SOBP multi-domain protein [Pyrenophora teres f. teres]